MTVPLGGHVMGDLNEEFVSHDRILGVVFNQCVPKAPVGFRANHFPPGETADHRVSTSWLPEDRGTVVHP